MVLPVVRLDGAPGRDVQLTAVGEELLPDWQESLWSEHHEHHEGDPEGIDRYSEKALLRVLKAERFSWWFSGLLHRYPHQSAFDLKMQQADLAFLRDNESQQRAFAEN